MAQPISIHLYGAIKVIMPSVRWTNTKLFQFLYGAIKVRHRFVITCSCFLFQFLYGAIKVQPLNKLTKNVMLISIPVWCD